MKTILFVLMFVGGQPTASVAPMPSFQACEQYRMELTREIVKDPQITEFVVACHKTLQTKKGVSA